MARLSFGDSSEVQVFNQGGAILGDLALGPLTIPGDGRNRIGNHIAIAAVRTAARQFCFFDFDDVVAEVGEFFVVENRISFFMRVLYRRCVCTAVVVQEVLCQKRGSSERRLFQRSRKL